MLQFALLEKPTPSRLGLKSGRRCIPILSVIASISVNRREEAVFGVSSSCWCLFDRRRWNSNCYHFTEQHDNAANGLAMQAQKKKTSRTHFS